MIANNGAPLDRLVLSGYKSIKNCDLEFRALNVLIGANGAGKSNLLSFFRMMQQLLNSELQLFVSKQGGPDSLLYFGRKVTERLSAELYFASNGYKVALEPTNDNKMMFAYEAMHWQIDTKPDGFDKECGKGHFETNIDDLKGKSGLYGYVAPVLRSWRLYHFHDTGEAALMKQRQGLNDNSYLRPDARNIAAYLYLLQQLYPEVYKRIVQHIQLVAPFFGDFMLRQAPDSPDQIELEWTEKGYDVPFKASMLSDGTLRFICLATALIQPEETRPAAIIIDEPEQGLHPNAINVLSAMLRAASHDMQVIVSTQSTELLGNFEPEDIIVADRASNGTELKRLDNAALEDWLEDYSLRELWLKNIIGGQP